MIPPRMIKPNSIYHPFRPVEPESFSDAELGEEVEEVELNVVNSTEPLIPFFDSEQ